MLHIPKARNSKRRSGKSTPASAASPPPVLTADEVASLTARFDAKRWDATADADQAAEEAARQKQKPTKKRDDAKQRAAGSSPA